MKIKRILTLLAAIAILATTAVTPFTASAIVTNDSGSLQVLPGNTQSSSPVYNMAWLDNIIIRDDAMAVTQATIVPKADYPYSHTYEEFVREVASYKQLRGLNEQTVGQAYNEMIDVLFYVITACGMTVNEDAMARYVAKQGIRLPSELNGQERAELAIVYAAVRYDAIYVLYNKHVKILAGSTLEGAMTIILAELINMNMPSGINTVLGLGMYNMKHYVEGFDAIPVSENPDNSEVFHWVKVITAAEHEYPVPMTEYNSVSQAQADYVDCAYYASLFDTVYGVRVNPAALLIAENSPRNDEVAKLIVKTMLSDKGVSFNEDSSCETLFNLACQNGWFQLENEFYTDVLNYDLYVDKKCEKLWMTPFALADQLDGDNNFVKMYLGSKEMKPNETAFAPLDPKKDSEQVTLVVMYNDGMGKEESAVYNFNIIKVDKNTSSQYTPENDILANIQGQLSSVVPKDNEKANAVINKVIGAVDSQITPPETEKNKDIIPTYDVQSSTERGYDGEAPTMSSDADFDYLNQLFSETYTTAVYTESDDDQDNSSFAARAGEAVKENPEIIAAPTGVLAVSILAGYMLNTKKKSHFSPEDETDGEQ